MNEEINVWRDAITDPPKNFGWYKIKVTTMQGEFEAPFVRNGREELVWVLPDPSIITHWKEKIKL